MAGRRKPRFSTTVVPGDLLQERKAIQAMQARIKTKESANRAMLIDTFFPGAGYGSNSLDVDDGRTLTVTMGQTFKVDDTMLDAIREPMREQFGVNVDAIVRWKPELNKVVYDSLSEEERQFFAQCLTIKDDSPQLKITEPTRWRDPHGELPEVEL